MRRASRLLFVLTLAACDGGGDGDAGMDAALVPTDAGMDSGVMEEDAGGPGMDAGTDAGPPMIDGGSDLNAFLEVLDGTVWRGLATRDEGGDVGVVERAFEMRFVAGGAPMWGEIRNPYGPARLRIRRFIRPTAAGCGSASRCTIETTISIPDATWETPPELRGRREEWTLEIIDGSPRALAIRNEATGVEEIYDEGEWPAPTSGLTAEVRVFEGGSGNPIADAFCESGGTAQDRALVWSFARGDDTGEPVLAYDAVAGAPLRRWIDQENRFGIRDVDGFDTGTLGGSERTDQFNFVVRYTGVVEHPGGSFRMRERDDAFEDVVWAFVGSDVGGVDDADCPLVVCSGYPTNSLFLEVHGFAWCDCTAGEGSATLAAADVPIEIILTRCSMEFGSRALEVEMSLGGGSYSLIEAQPTRPIIDDTLFPPVL